METTDREVLGVDLASPQTDDRGHEHHGYTLVREVQAGDVVFHYHTDERAIVAWSRATGSFWEEDIVWASHGAVAREAGVVPYRRPGFRHGLDGPYWLDEPVTLTDLREAEDMIRAAREVVAESVKGPLYFPLALSDSRPLRPTQFYLTKFPVILTEVFPQLAGALEAAQRMPAAETADGLDLVPDDRRLGRAYEEADEEAATSERDPFEVDPNVVDRSLRAHARVQNDLARNVIKLGYEPLSPTAGDPKFDIAWTKNGQLWVAEVKSLTPSNEEMQLRLGLGQVLRYRNLLASEFDVVTAVLAVEREPTDPAWGALCAELGVILVWPGNFDQLS